MRKLLPVLLALVGLLAGAGAGFFLRSPPAAEPDAAGHAAPAEAGTEAGHGEPQKGEAAAAHGAADATMAHDGASDSAEAAKGYDYVKLNNQFIVPIVSHGKVASLVIMSLSLEVAQGNSSRIYTAEPKLRDAFLRVLFDHANAGGFDGNFTEGTKMQALRNALREVAVKLMGPVVANVLIDDIVRQDN